MNRERKIGARLSCALIGLALGVATVSVASVPTKPWTKQAAQVDLTAFWEKFRDAVIRGDKETVAALAQFPISRGYGMKSLKNKGWIQFEVQL